MKKTMKPFFFKKKKQCQVMRSKKKISFKKLGTMSAYKTHDPSHLIGSTKTKKTIKLKIKKKIKCQKMKLKKKSITKYNSKEKITIKRMMIKFEERERERGWKILD